MTAKSDDPKKTPTTQGRRWKRSSTSLFSQGEPMVWLTGGGLIISLLMIVGLLILVFYQGMGTFWPSELPRFETGDGQVVMGEVARAEIYGDGEMGGRKLVRTGNFDLTGEHFRWIEDSSISGRTLPPWALVVERTEWGIFYGFPKAFIFDGQTVADEPAGIYRKYKEFHGEVSDRRDRRRRLETVNVGKINHTLEKARLAIRSAELKSGQGSPSWEMATKEYEAAESRASEEFKSIRQQIDALNRSNSRYIVVMETAQGQEKQVPLADIVRAYPANSLNFADRVGIYLSRWTEFLTDEPREANSEGGVFPAIFGTVVMTLIMSLAVMPFGVMAALYLREYARAGTMISIVRISINNLAGVPSIVFGVFGLGFFCYIIGASLDQLLFAEHLPDPTFGKGGVLWAALTLALLTLPVVIVATEEALAAVPNSMREGSYACGASKWQTIKRIILPRAMPGIMTGMILAMARGAGEVAPLMLVGAVKLAPELPIDGIFPYIHAERSFMHLGFHIYDLGFQSQNSEAAKPMVFTTTLLLIGIVFLLNVVAVRLRTRLRKKFESATF
ncbi:MAG: phosphate ABC transporter permease PstA [bacterium]|nr:phosphate ABC transporter permease PstA [bacterium]MDT8365675.1 phosphate ABC transporter permease PstA [bacterium]